MNPCDSVRALEIAMRIKVITRELGSCEHEVEERKAWIAQLPEGADEARRLTQTAIDDKERQMALTTRSKAFWVADLDRI